MIVQLLKPWNNWDAGQVFMTMQDSVAEVLVMRGVGIRLPSPTTTASLEVDKEAVSKQQKATKKNG